MTRLLSLCGVLAALLLTPGNGAAAPTATVTLLQGNGSLISGIKRYNLAVGYRLKPADIIELDQHSMLQIETDDGTTVAFDGGSRAMMFPERGDMLELFLLRGVVKIAVPKGALSVKLDTPQFDMQVAGATVVAMVSAGEGQLFAEVGPVKLTGNGTEKTLNTSDYCLLKPGLGDAVVSALPQSFVQALPAAFKDALPNLLPELKDSSDQLGGERDFSYSEVQEWLDTVPPVRKLLVDNWEAKSHDPPFRKALIRDLSKHPEWRPVLFPPRHRHGRR